MKQNSPEHQAFEKHCKAKSLNRETHHLLYLNQETIRALEHFQAGYAEGARAAPRPKLRTEATTTYEFWRGHDHADWMEAKGAGGIYNLDLPASLTRGQIRSMAEFIAEGVLGVGEGAISFRPMNCEVGFDAPTLVVYDTSGSGSLKEAMRDEKARFLYGNFHGTTSQLADISNLVETINACAESQSDYECFVLNTDKEYIPIAKALINGESPWM